MDSNVPDSLLTQHLPSEYTPGGDRISRMLMKNQSVVDFISHDSMGTPNGTYKVADADWNGTRPDILYMPALSALGFLPPLLIEIQNTIDSQFLQRLIGYSLNVVKVYKTLPVVLVFGVHKISPSNLLL
ncbi:hypothetical protein RMATCC62417_17596 [Rhizopus microsporus]|nr:hypothetical protein RMATCC62417_17596 [Rhizopus microsporus]